MWAAATGRGRSPAEVAISLKADHVNAGDIIAPSPPRSRSSKISKRLRRTSFFEQLGPGLVTGAADDDPSGIATYSQAGAQFGYNMLWTMLLTYPLMTAVQLVSALRSTGAQMLLIVWFLALVAAGDLLAYLVGLFVEYEWGSYPSLVVFLAMYFITLWVAWRIAVWMTTPKLVPDGTGAGVA